MLEDDCVYYLVGMIDVEYKFGFVGKEWGEFMGVVNCIDYDFFSYSEVLG